MCLNISTPLLSVWTGLTAEANTVFVSGQLGDGDTVSDTVSQTAFTGDTGAHGNIVQRPRSPG